MTSAERPAPRSTWPRAPSCTSTTAAALMAQAMTRRNSSRLRSFWGRRSRFTGPVAVRGFLACSRAAVLLSVGIAQLFHDRLGRLEVVGVDGLLDLLPVVLREVVDRHVRLLVEVRQADRPDALLHALI